MKRKIAVVVIAIAVVAIWGGFRAKSAPETALSKFVPAEPMLVLQAKDFNALLATWNASAQKKQWVTSTSYEVFSNSRLFLRLKAAGDQFAVAAGIPPDMKFLTQVAGDNSIMAVYDIGKMQFLYITRLPSAQSMQTALWQTRAKFQPRKAGNADFYVRRDPESEREVAFAVSGEHLLLATREDLLAGALQLMAGSNNRNVETEEWWVKATSTSDKTGDLRMAMDLERIVPDGHFRTYWVQQNITDLSQYSAAISDLFLEGAQYREERTLIRKEEPDQTPAPEALTAAADLVALAPQGAGAYQAHAQPNADECFALLDTKLLAPHFGAAPASEYAPQVQLTSVEAGGGSDLETRTDQTPIERQVGSAKSALQLMLENSPVLASLQVQSTELSKAGVFVRMHTAIVLVGDTNWNEPSVQAAIADYIRPALTAGQLGVSWQARNGHQELNGLWPLSVAIRGKYLVVSDDVAFMQSMLASLDRKSDQKPAEYFAHFDHQRERENFAKFANVVDRPHTQPASDDAQFGREPQFFSGTIASLSATLSGVSAEDVVIRSEGNNVRQTVTYEWSR